MIEYVISDIIKAECVQCTESQVGVLVKQITDEINNITPKPDKNWNFAWEDNYNMLETYFRLHGDKIHINDVLYYLIPKYMFNREYILYKGNFYKANNNLVERHVLNEMLRYFLGTFLKEGDTLAEIGCGTLYNLLYVDKFIPVHLHAYDWSKSSESIAGLLNVKGYSHIRFKSLNMLKPPKELAGCDVLFTCGSMEQLFTSFKPIIDCIIKTQPKYVIHIEPIVEFYNHHMHDKLQKLYHVKRDYLNGLYIYLKSHKKVKILETMKTGFGNIYNSGYSVIVWQPV